MYFLWTYFISNSFADTIFVPTRTKEQSQQMVLESLYRGLQQNGWDVHTSAKPCFTYNCHNSNVTNSEFYVRVFFSERKGQLTAQFLLYDQRYSQPVGRYSIHSSSWEGLSEKARVAPRSWVRESTRTSKDPSMHKPNMNVNSYDGHKKPIDEPNNKTIPTKTVPTKTVLIKDSSNTKQAKSKVSNQQLAQDSLNKGLCSEANSYVRFWLMEEPRNVEIKKYEALVSECKKDDVLVTLGLFQEYVDAGGLASSVSKNIDKLVQQLAQASISIQKESNNGSFINATSEDFYISFSEGDWVKSTDSLYNLAYSHPSSYRISVKSSDVWYADAALTIDTKPGTKEAYTVQLNSIENQLKQYLRTSKCSDAQVIIDDFTSKNIQDPKLKLYQAEGLLCQQNWLEALTLYEMYRSNGGTQDISKQIQTIEKQLYNAEIQVEIPNSSDKDTFDLFVNNIKQDVTWIDNQATIEIKRSLPQEFEVRMQSSSVLYPSLTETWTGLAGTTDTKKIVISNLYSEIATHFSKKECDLGLEKLQAIRLQRMDDNEVNFYQAEGLLCQQNWLEALTLFEMYRSNGGTQDISKQIQTIEKQLYNVDYTITFPEGAVPSMFSFVFDGQIEESVWEGNIAKISIRRKEPKEYFLQIQSSTPLYKNIEEAVQGRAGITDSKKIVVRSEIDDINTVLRRKECSVALERTQKLFEQLPNTLDVVYTHAQALLCENTSPLETLLMFEQYQSSGGERDISTELEQLHSLLYQCEVSFRGSETDLDFSKIDISVDDARWKSVGPNSFLLQYTEPKDITVEVTSRSPFIESKSFILSGVAGVKESKELVVRNFKSVQLLVPNFSKDLQVQIERVTGDSKERIELKPQRNVDVGIEPLKVFVQTATDKELQYTLEMSPQDNNLLLPWSYDIIFDDQVLYTDFVSPLELEISMEDVTVKSPITQVENIHVQYNLVGEPNQHISLLIDDDIISSSNLLQVVSNINDTENSMQRMKRRKIVLYGVGALSVGFSGYMQYLAYNYAMQANQIQDVEDAELFSVLESNLRLMNINTGMGLSATALSSGSIFVIGKWKLPKAQENMTQLLDDLSKYQQEIIDITPDKTLKNPSSSKNQSNHVESTKDTSVPPDIEAQEHQENQENQEVQEVQEDLDSKKSQPRRKKDKIENGDVEGQ